jgi:hypothetical protein
MFAGSRRWEILGIGEGLLCGASPHRQSSANGVEELDVEMAFLYRSIFRRRC